MTRCEDKGELYSLIALLHGRGWTTPTIARVLCYSRKHVHRIICDLGLVRYVRFADVDTALAELPPDVVERIRHLRKVTLEPSHKAKAETPA